MITNDTLSEVYNRNAAAIGIDMSNDDRETMGSIDMGNVSQVVPAINPYFEITNGKKMSLHTVEFRECTKTEFGYQAMMNTIEVLVRTAYDVIDDEALLQKIKAEFAQIPVVTN